jgi:hypothetical protein
VGSYLRQPASRMARHPGVRLGRQQLASRIGTLPEKVSLVVMVEAQWLAEFAPIRLPSSQSALHRALPPPAPSMPANDRFGPDI